LKYFRTLSNGSMNIEIEKAVVNEVELEYSILGKKEEEPIIFIHGGILLTPIFHYFQSPH
jgi:hypothetical protein